ncbi:MAG: hypothetical protein M8866_11185 [marine benthic group bacterium]|jgi:hypothetical protein|nr:hypothetical protein [Candidatus Benthicola marisminoris]
MTETRNEDLSRAEREALDALPREANPGELLEERTVKALREEGLLAAGAAPVGQAPSREAAVPRPWWQLVAAIAASIALFAGGVSVGQVLGARQTADAFQTVFEDGDALLAAQVQRTGSDYVAALAALAETSGAVADSSQALEVALTALWAAANEIVRLAPDDVLTARILQGFEAQARESSDYGAESQLLVEF